LKVPDCLEGEELLIISHGVPVAARCDTSQVKPSFLAAVPALRMVSEWIWMGMWWCIFRRYQVTNFMISGQPLRRLPALSKENGGFLRSCFCRLYIPWGMNS